MIACTKKYISFFIFLFSASAFLCAQNIYISQPEKLTTELIGFDILGKTKSGDVLIYKKYRDKDEILLYDKQLNIKRRKDITMKNVNYETAGVIKLNDAFYHFYTLKENKNSYLYFQRYNSDIEKKDDPGLLDSTSLRLGDNFSEYNILRSNNNTFILIYKYELSNGNIDKLNTLVLNDAGDIIQRNVINLPDNDFSANLVKADINNFGKPVFLFQNDLYSCKKEKSSIHYYFVFPGSADQFASAQINNYQDTCIRALNFDLDSKTGQIIAAGYTGDDIKDAMTGYVFMRIDPASGQITETKGNTFSQELLNEIAGAIDKPAKYVPVYEVTSIIPRQDGGALLAGEYYQKSIENYEYTNYDPYYGYRTSTRQVEYYEYNDIFLLSLNPEGNIDWHNIIRKKQLSKEDKGVNSSYGLANGKQKLYFIFNEDITQNNNVLQYEMLADGSLDRKSLFNPNQQEVELRPAAARQISYNEIIIPSIYKRNLAFVKVIF